MERGIMPKKKQELSPDTVLKNYWNNNEQFADLFNATLFDGEQIIKADELVDVDTVGWCKIITRNVKHSREDGEICK